MVYQAVYDKNWHCVLWNVAARTHNAICNHMEHQIWNICDVIYINKYVVYVSVSCSIRVCFGVRY